MNKEEDDNEPSKRPASTKVCRSTMHCCHGVYKINYTAIG